jgi:hypothetical protein
MGPDSRVLVRKSRKQAQAYHRLYEVSLLRPTEDAEFQTIQSIPTRVTTVVDTCFFRGWASLLYAYAMEVLSGIMAKADPQNGPKIMHIIILYNKVGGLFWIS